jgi:hypothetical protein
MDMDMVTIYSFVVFPRGHFPIAKVESQMELKMLGELFPDAVDFPHACNLLPANLLFVNNLIPFGGCMGYTWTFAIQFQFYLILPLLWKVATKCQLNQLSFVHMWLGYPCDSDLVPVVACYGSLHVCLSSSYSHLSMTPNDTKVDGEPIV